MSESITQTEKWLQINLKVKEKYIVEIFQLLRQHEIEPILIKGLAAAQYYPQRYKRNFVDSDICVAPEQYQKAEEVLKNNCSHILVDLHKGLREHDTVEWSNLFENSVSLVIDDYPVRVLRPEDHLRVLCVHWLTDGGEYKERLYDIYWLVNNREQNFDWERCLNTVDETRRRWIICVIGIAHKYLNLEINDLPFAEEAKNLPNWLTRTIEKEWQSEVRIIPLKNLLSQPKILIRQIKKRIPPNPITSTILVGGSLDGRTRAFYQIKSFYQRLIPSIKDNWKTLFGGRS